MLDDIEKAAIELLGLSVDEVRTIRESLVTEVATDEARYAARTALKHPEGSTTPLNDSADRAQQTYARVRAKAMKDLPKLMSLILAERVARQQRDEAAAARDKHWDEEHERRAVGPHPETRDLFGRLFEHGVTPWHLKALRDEEVAIIADLIRWKANDAKHKNLDTPWRPVLQIYADRLILETGYGVTVKRSKLGTPVHGKRYTSPRHYMFNEMVEPHWGLSPAVTVLPTSDISNAENDDAQAGGEPPTDQTVGTEQVADSLCGNAAAPAAAPADASTPTTISGADGTSSDEFALPAHVTEAEAATLLALGDRWADGDDDWNWHLRDAIGYRDQTDDEAIASVAAAELPKGATPFRYFLNAARQSGVEAGKAAYRAATVRRFALEFATLDEWKDARRSHGMTW